MTGTDAAGEGAVPAWCFRLYVAGQAPRSLFALANLRGILEEHLPGDYDIEVVDLVAEPSLARRDDILAIPTVVRARPEPRRRIIGDLSDRPRAVSGLGLWDEVAP